MNKLVALVALSLTACGASKDTGSAETPDAAPQASTTTSPDAVVATWEGGQLTQAELDDAVGMRLLTQEVEFLQQQHDTKVQALEAMIRDAILEDEASSRDMTLDELFAVEVEAKAATPSDQQIETFYAQNAPRMGGASLDEARPFIIAQLSQDAQGTRFRTWYTELREARGVDIALPAPELPRIEVPIAEDDPVFGEADAPITIVQFAEYECYYCARAMPTVDRVLEEYDGKVKLVFKDYPLGFHARARPAAIAAHCAGEQDKYWDMNHLLLGNQQALADSDFVAHAETLSLDIDAFNSCLTSGRFEEGIDADMATAESVGVSATPTFFVDGVMLAGAMPYEKFAEVLDRALADAE